MPKVSVVIPAYNTMKYLPATLESVLQQTFADFEVLMINDGSSDGIVAWVNELTDPRVRLISQPNQGLPGARNTGILNAQGEYVAFLDADDLWEPTKLEKQVRCLDEQPEVGVVYTWSLLVDEQGQSIGRIHAGQGEGNLWKQLLLGEDPIANGSAAMVRRCCFDTVGLFDTSLKSAEDLDMWLRIAAHYPFAGIKEPLTLYRQHPHSMSKNRQRMFHSLRVVIEKAFQSVPLELLYLRNRAYASIFLGLGWLAVNEGDYKNAIAHRKQALLHRPLVVFSERFVRLSLAIFLIRWFGPHGYDGVRDVTRYVRQLMLRSAT